MDGTVFCHLYVVRALTSGRARKQPLSDRSETRKRCKTDASAKIVGTCPGSHKITQPRKLESYAFGKW
ncbi:uncharacterized protein ANIA_11285 [Aspergillus nidulans FGSC A4]|uniref:Uncharacterized protein n=1 Tax=Emericella nidulans (strain FGSC A4 / ATCC 38163 / CBS 112.46 / NRRL 194 / M139) TaxID=227321 RepID=C8VUG8_EMENI|nr:hypothetical protein [Aspergillus nidulans FGSC A4]CBF88459.1 TPA: hypothetical protein ANIA_11285 [Aspergillus nidulans FGSC A4]